LHEARDLDALARFAWPREEGNAAVEVALGRRRALEKMRLKIRQ